MAGIFVNYRRDDTSGHAGRLYDRLTNRFGRSRIFMDLDIEPGADFEQAIRRQVDLCDVFLVLIGRHWLTIPDRTGRPRLEDDRDWTRLEIQIALERNIPIIPILVHGAKMPTRDELPQPLRKLATRSALELSDSRWEYDANRLMQAVANWVQTDAEFTTGKSGFDEHTSTDGRDFPRTATTFRSPGYGALRRVDWPEFTMSAAIAFTWFWVVPRWGDDAWSSASGNDVEEVIAVSMLPLPT